MSYFKNFFKSNVTIMILSWLFFGIGNALVRPYFSLYIKMLGGGDIHIGLINSIGSIFL